MAAVLSALLAGFATLLRPPLALQLEISSLRHLLATYQPLWRTRAACINTTSE